MTPHGDDRPDDPGPGATGQGERGARGDGEADPRRMTGNRRAAARAARRAGAALGSILFWVGVILITIGGVLDPLFNDMRWVSVFVAGCVAFLIGIVIEARRSR
jgi:hypothetical protein